MRASLGALAACLPIASAVAGEPIIMGMRRVSPDPEETTRIEQRKGSAFSRADVSSPFTDDFSGRAMLVPIPIEAPRSKRDQNARDEKLNWMVLDRGDLTDSEKSDELFGISSMSLEKETGRRDFFFTKPEDRGAGPDRRLPGSATSHEAEDRSAQSAEAPSVAVLAGKKTSDGEERDDSSTPADGLMGFGSETDRGEEELGLGPLLNPTRVSGSQAFERWSSSLKDVTKPRSQGRISDARDRREHYLNFLNSAQYGGASYPVGSEWGKYQREWVGSAAPSRQPASSGALPDGISGSPLADSPLSMTPPSAGSSLIQGRLSAPRGNLSGVGGLPSYLQDRRPPSQRPRPDYSLPKAPGRGIDF